MDYPLNLPEQFRPQLQALRRQRGWTQAQLGAALGVTQARVAEIEAKPGAVSLQQILQVLHVLGAGLVMRVHDAPAGDDAATSAPASRGEW